MIVSHCRITFKLAHYLILVLHLSFPIFSGIPDFAEVYSFIGGIFDPDTQGHVQKLKEMDPINFETVSSSFFQTSLELICKKLFEFFASH